MNFPNFSDLVPAATGFVGDIITNQQDPQLAYMWEVRVEGQEPKNFEKSIQLFAQSVTIPQRSVEEIRRKYIGETVVHAGSASDPKQLRITFYDDKRLIAYRYFMDWMNTVSDPSYGRQASSTKTRKKVNLKLKDRSDFFVGVEIDFNRAMITTIGDVTLSYDESAPFIFNVTISFDSMIFNGVDYSGRAVTETETDYVDSLNGKVRGTVNSAKEKVSEVGGSLF